MEQLSEELKNLQKTISTFSLFGRKVQNISKLKRSFFEKMIAHQQQENVEQAKLYYSYFIRAEQLSIQIYTNMKQNFEELNSLINQNSMVQREEIEQAFQGIESQPILNCKQTFTLFHVTQEQHIQALRQFLHSVLKEEDICSKLLSLTNKEEEDVQDINNSSSDFFKKLEDQKEIHQLLSQEELVSNRLQALIKSLVAQTTSFSQKIIELSKQLQQQFINLSREFRSSPQHFVIERFFTPFTHLIEKHASVIALSAITLGIIANISALAGIGGVAMTARTTMYFLSHTLEGVEALPSVQSIAHKSTQIIQQAIQKSHNMLNV